jgi:hypothetical protein
MGFAKRPPLLARHVGRRVGNVTQPTSALSGSMSQLGQKPKYRRLNLTSALLSKADFRTVFLSSCLAQSSDNVQLSKPTNSLRTRRSIKHSFEKRNPLLWPRIWFFGGARGIARHVDLNAIAISGAAGADPVRIIGKSVPRRAPANALIPPIDAGRAHYCVRTHVSDRFCHSFIVAICFIRCPSREWLCVILRGSWRRDDLCSSN